MGWDIIKYGSVDGSSAACRESMGENIGGTRIADVGDPSGNLHFNPLNGVAAECVTRMHKNAVDRTGENLFAKTASGLQATSASTRPR